MVWWLVSLPLEGTRDNTWNILQNKTVYEKDLSSNHKFNIPELRVGTLDSLMHISGTIRLLLTGRTVFLETALSGM